LNLLIFLRGHDFLRFKFPLLELLFNNLFCDLRIFLNGVIHVQINFVYWVWLINFNDLFWAFLLNFYNFYFRLDLQFFNRFQFLWLIFLLLDLIFSMSSINMLFARSSIFTVFTFAKPWYAWQTSLKALTISFLAFWLLTFATCQMLLLILINFFFESIDIPPKDIFDGLPSLFFMLLIIVANSILLKFLALTLGSTSCVISKTNTIELQTLIVFTFAPRTRNNGIILPLLLLEQLILSNGFAHNFLSHFLDSLFFFFLLLFFFHNWSTSRLMRDSRLSHRLCQLLLFNFLSCACTGLRLNFVSNISHTDVIVLCSIRIIPKLHGLEIISIIHIKMRGCYKISLVVGHLVKLLLDFISRHWKHIFLQI